MDNPGLGSLTMCFGKVGLAVGTTTTTSIATARDFCIKGKAYSGAVAANGATPTTDAVTGLAFNSIAVNKAGVFVWCYDSSSALKCVQGEIVDYSDAAVFAKAPQFPEIPVTLCPIGYELVKIISTGSAWVMGVNNQAALTGITKVMVDCATLPDRPQIS